MRVEHTSRYRYRSEVRSSYNEARMTAMTTPEQQTIESNLSVEPRCRPFRYTDYWGTVVHAFDLHAPHAELRVDAVAVVETGDTRPVEATLGWDDLAGPKVRDSLGEYLEATAYVPDDSGVAELAAELRAGGGPAAAVEAAAGWVSDNVSYAKGATKVSTSCTEVFDRRVGVCQDYAHLTLGVLRAMGIPARYVSGYLHPRPDAVPGDSVVGESHAWVEAWLGPWHGLDPTHAGLAGARHVLVARGRDYADVPPLKGVYRGGQAEDLEVSVVVTRLS
ncbi:MAG: transglutaminase family protein [Acidimicrobiia bacterium]|nr:transglutaminase family protein [Acidimicrobiia bacterium]